MIRSYLGRKTDLVAAIEALHSYGVRVFADIVFNHMANECRPDPGEHIRRVFESGDLEGRFLFGESLTANDREEQIFLWPLLGETGMSFYDFPLHETMRRVFAPGGSMRELVDPTAFAQALPWTRAVTCSVPHDIPNNDGFRWQLLDRQDEFLATVYIMARDGGLPLVYSDHNESAAKFPEDRDRWADAWQRADITAMIGFHNAVHGLPQRPLYEDDGFLVLARGDRGLVAINKTGYWCNPCIYTDGLRKGAYLCLLHGHDMQVESEPFSFAIPPRQAQLWLHNG